VIWLEIVNLIFGNLNMYSYKKYFPIFKNNPDLHYLDSGATALKPQVVLDKMMEYYTEYSANIHRGLYPISERATTEYDEVRKKVKEFIGAEFESEIIFTSGTTDSLNLVARSWGENNLQEGDEIVVTEIEHHSNLVPWQQLAKKKKIILSFLPITNYELRITNEITKNTKLLAITHVSNVLGEINPIKEIVKKAREINPDICVVVDGAQAVPHIPVDVVELDVDFYAFSGHKLYGPTGVGVLYAKGKRQMEMLPSRFGGGMINAVTLEKSTWAIGPEKFEAGTPPIAQVIGLGAAIDFVKSVGIEKIVKHENELTKYLFEKLKELSWINIVGEEYSENRLGTVAIVSKVPVHDMADILGRHHNVCVRAGHHCTMPLHQKLGVIGGTTRISLGIYNDKEDIDKLIVGLKEAREIFSAIGGSASG
jgi:cysteine desulfurase/selenocysteine lyase